MVTAKAHSEDVVEALGNGANDYVTKPIDFPVALARIQAQLPHRRRPPADDEVMDARDLRAGHRARRPLPAGGARGRGQLRDASTGRGTSSWTTRSR